MWCSDIATFFAINTQQPPCYSRVPGPVGAISDNQLYQSADRQSVTHYNCLRRNATVLILVLNYFEDILLKYSRVVEDMEKENYISKICGHRYKGTARDLTQADPQLAWARWPETCCDEYYVGGRHHPAHGNRRRNLSLMRQKIGLAASLCDNCFSARVLTIPCPPGHWPRDINSRGWSCDPPGRGPGAGSSDRGSPRDQSVGRRPDLSTWFRLLRLVEYDGLWLWLAEEREGGIIYVDILNSFEGAD